MKRLIPLLAVLVGCTATEPPSQSSQTFRLGTFQADGEPFVGVVLGDSLVIDLAAANDEVGTSLDAATAPADMKDLIERYDGELRPRIREIVGFVESASSPPAFAHGLAELTILPPIMYPTNMVHTALNYREHATEMAGLNSGPPALVDGAPPPGSATPTTTSAPGIWERSADDGRWNP